MSGIIGQDARERSFTPVMVKAKEGNMDEKTGLASDYKELAKEIMESYPEYSFCLTCISWKYSDERYVFLDEEDGKKHTVTTAMIAEALPKLRKKIEDKNLFFDGLHSGTESFMDPGDWDSISTDAAVQMAVFGDVIYG